MTTDTTTIDPLRPGDELHVVCEHSVLLFGLALTHGDAITVTQRQIDSQRGTDERSWCDDLSDEAQLSRWGEIRLARGPWPTDQPRWVHGSPEWADAREQARQRAWKIEGAAERAAAREAVERVFGPAPSTSRTLNKAPAAQQRPSGNPGR